MPENTITGWKKSIREHCNAHGINKSDSQISRMATKLHKRAEFNLDKSNFFEAMRILGLISDTTPRDAVDNMERANHWRVAL